MDKQIKVVIKKPNEEPYVEMIEDTLSKLQGIVGGYIEVVPYNEDGSILVVCNEEGKLRRLKPNIPFGKIDVLVGTIFFVGENAPEFRSLTDIEIDWLLKKLKNYM